MIASVSERLHLVRLCESGDPLVVLIYKDLDDARELLESLDVAAIDEAFLQTGQAVTVTASKVCLTENALAAWVRPVPPPFAKYSNSARAVRGHVGVGWGPDLPARPPSDWR